MTTTDVMESEDIGGLSGRHFLKMFRIATGMAVAGIAAITLLSHSIDTDSEKQQAAVVHTVGEDKTRSYKKAEEKYGELVEVGREYVAQKHGVPVEQVSVVVLDEIKAGQGPKGPGGLSVSKEGWVTDLGEDILPPNESGLFAAYAHPNGYTTMLVENNNRKVHEYRDVVFCNPEMKSAGELIRDYIIRNRLNWNREFAFTDIHKDENSTSDVYRAYGIQGWNNQRRRTILLERYAVDLATKEITTLSGGYIFGNNNCR